MRPFGKDAGFDATLPTLDAALALLEEFRAIHAHQSVRVVSNFEDDALVSELVQPRLMVAHLHADAAVRRLVADIRSQLPPETTCRLDFEPGDAALEREDVVDHLAQGQASLARWVRQMRLKAEKVPQDSAVRYHVVVSRQMPGSERLQGMLDARLRRLHQQGLLPLKPGTPVQEMP